jgi:hypothetical protein
MKMAIVPMRLLLSLLMLGFTHNIAMSQTPNESLKSRAELSNYEETSRYEDVMQFIRELQKQSVNFRVEYFGKTEQGRDLPLMIFADPPLSQPSEARATGKPLIFIQANIHAGEVEGKEAMIQLARRLANGDLKLLLEHLIILIAPIYNADGNEKIELTNRPAQYGPIGGVGTRENAKGLDLNRDYMKLESIEANALVGLFNRWDPHLTVDLHTTNGSYHGYHLTYAPTLNPNADARLIAFERNKLLPAVTRALAKTHKFRAYFYGNFATKERMNREINTFEMERSGREATPAESPETKIWRTFDHRPRFGNNYCGLRNRLTILSEAYSYLDFKTRIAVTEAFVEEILRYSARTASEIVALIKKVDETAVRGPAGERAVAFELKALDKPVEILVGEVQKIKNPRSGKMMTVVVENKITPVSMPDYGLFSPIRSIPLPAAYLFRNDNAMKIVIDKLLAHGVVIEELTDSLKIEVDKFVIDDVKTAARAFQGHAEVKLKGHTEKEMIDFPAGSILVRTSQQLSSLIFYLLEAESDDGFVNWNFLDGALEKGKSYPIFKVAKPVLAASRRR